MDEIDAEGNLTAIRVTGALIGFSIGLTLAVARPSRRVSWLGSIQLKTETTNGPSCSLTSAVLSTT